MSGAEVPWYTLPIVFGASVSQIWTIAGPFLTAFIVAAVTHYSTRSRDYENFRLRLDEEARLASRRIRRERLLDAFRALDSSEPQRVNFLKLSREAYSDLLQKRSAALSDINLFGDEELANAVDKIIEKGQEQDTSLIMNLLRDRLREEFGLEPTQARYKWVVVKLNESKTT